MKILSAVIAAFLVWILLHPAVVAAQSDRYTQQIHRLLDTSPYHQQLLNKNYQMLSGGRRIGSLRAGNTNYQPSNYSLAAGYVYTFLGVCDTDCSDLDLALYSGTTRLQGDTDPDDTPLLNYYCSRSGEYQIRATIPDCDSTVCFYGIQAYFK